MVCRYIGSNCNTIAEVSKILSARAKLRRLPQRPRIIISSSTHWVYISYANSCSNRLNSLITSTFLFTKCLRVASLNTWKILVLKSTCKNIWFQVTYSCKRCIYPLHDFLILRVHSFVFDMK